MANYLLIGLHTEGDTDNKFLESIVRRTYEAVAFGGRGDIDIDVFCLNIDKRGLGFVEQVKKAAKEGYDSFGVRVLCVHTDADDRTDEAVFANKITPARAALCKLDESEGCKICSFAVPVHEMESWMLADKTLLKKQIGTDMSDAELGINKKPEEITHPKEAIEEAVRIARRGLRQRFRGNLAIADLYLPIGQKVELEQLDALPSYIKFKKSVTDSLRALGLHD
jgi:hypothetical protein